MLVEEVSRQTNIYCVALLLVITHMKVNNKKDQAWHKEIQNIQLEEMKEYQKI